MRILANNLIETAALTVPNTAAGMGAGWLATGIKSEICRVLGSTASITAAWDADALIDTVLLPSIVVSPTATVRVRIYSASEVVVADTGAVIAAPGATLAEPSHVAVYLPATTGRRMLITLSDSRQTRLDIPGLAAGRSIQPRYNAAYGAGISYDDLSEHVRSAAGDLRTEIGTVSPVLQFDLEWIHEDDREEIRRVLAAGKRQLMFFDLLPQDPDSYLRIYGKQEQGGAMSLVAYSLHSSSFRILGW